MPKVNLSTFKDISHLDWQHSNVALLNGRVFSPNSTFQLKNIFFRNGKMVNRDVFEKSIPSISQAKIIDLEKNYVTPSIVDQHIHGGYGMDFNTASEEQIRNFLTETKKMGYGSILATFIPAPPEILNKQMDMIRGIMRNPQKTETIIEGFHLEGPFLSPKKSGIHSLDKILTPTLENVSKLNLDDVKIVTIAPELDKDFAVCKYLTERGIIVSAGHSTATAKEVVDSGATQVTHIFNAMSPLHHREGTIANAGLYNDNIFAEVICTPEHLSSDTVNTILAMKPKEQIGLISDALSGTNIKEKSFMMNGKEIFINPNHTATDKDGVIAGSIRLISQTAKELVDTTKMTFADFITFATKNPARNLGISDSYTLAIGKKPNLTIWDKNTLEPISTFICYG